MFRTVSAQDSAAVRFLVDPGHSFKVRVNGGAVQQLREMRTVPGEHRFSFWAPGRLVADTSLTLPAGVRRDLILELPVDPEYLVYKEQLRRHKARRRRAWLPALATLGVGVYTLDKVMAQRVAVDDLESIGTKYMAMRDPNEIRQFKTEELSARQDRADELARQALVGGVVLGVLATASVLVIARTYKKEAPQPSQRTRMQFEGLAWLPGGPLLCNLSVSW